MFSKRFMAWVGVGVLSVATIPAFAAPHLARLAARHPVAKSTPNNKTKPAATKLAAKPVAHKVATLAHVPAKITTKKTSSVHASRLAAVTHKTSASKKKNLTAGHKLTKPAAHKTLAAGPHHAAAAKPVIH
jgi:hypothetical protein